MTAALQTERNVWYLNRWNPAHSRRDRHDGDLQPAICVDAVHRAAQSKTRYPDRRGLATGLKRFFGWGEIFSLFPSTLTDTFEPKYAATNYGFLYIAQGRRLDPGRTGRGLSETNDGKLDRGVYRRRGVGRTDRATRHHGAAKHAAKAPYGRLIEAPWRAIIEPFDSGLYSP
jgi:hypothetical protein